MPRPCRAVKGLERISHFIYTVRPCLIHTCHAAPMPSPTMPVFSRPRHSTTVERLLSRFRLLPATTRRSTKVVIRSIPISDTGGQYETKHRLSWTRKRVVAANYKKDDLLNCWTSSSDISRLPCRHSRRTRHCRSRAGARHGMCQLTYFMTGERHGHGMLCVNRPWELNMAVRPDSVSFEQYWTAKFTWKFLRYCNKSGKVSKLSCVGAWLCLWKTVECQRQSCDRSADKWGPADSQGNKGTSHVELRMLSGEGHQ